MPRRTPQDRLPKALDAAAAAFVEHGFQRTQMDDIAERLGVSKGTIYRAVDSKESLFAAVIEWGDDPDSAAASGVRSSVDIAEVATTVTAGLAAAVATLELTTIVATRRTVRSADPLGDEIERITVGLHQLMRSRRTAVMVLDRCAGEILELAAVWTIEHCATIAHNRQAQRDFRVGHHPRPTHLRHGRGSRMTTAVSVERRAA